MDNKGLPTTTLPKKPQSWLLSLPLHPLVLLALVPFILPAFIDFRRSSAVSAPRKRNILSRCSALASKPSIPPGFETRTESDRYEEGTKPVLIRNATIWTGNKDGHEVLYGADVLLARGIIEWVGEADGLRKATAMYGKALETVNADGAWVTPG